METPRNKFSLPKHLTHKSREWARSVLRDFSFSEWDFKILIQAAEALSRVEQCRKVIDKEGLTVLNRFGETKAHPLLDAEKAQRDLFRRLYRELCLNVDLNKQDVTRQKGVSYND